jgi:hypothetical protein
MSELKGYSHPGRMSGMDKMGEGIIAGKERDGANLLDIRALR